MVKRGVAAIGLAAAGGAGYYLYNAGGDPKAAQKYAEGMFEANQVQINSSD